LSLPPAITLRRSPFPANAALSALWQRAWGDPGPDDFVPILRHGLGHVCAYAGEALIGFVNIAGDGGQHAFILDTCVDPDWRRQGIATALVAEATALARDKGATWLHVDFEPHLEPFYRSCGFHPTPAGLIRLR
jgi:GNAT superfamily N-acetyltransferase